METLNIVLIMLAVWRISHMIESERGPLGLFQRMHAFVAQNGWNQLGEFLSCFYCLATISSFVPAYHLSTNVKEFIFLTLAISGGASVIYAFTNYYEEQ